MVDNFRLKEVLGSDSGSDAEYVPKIKKKKQNAARIEEETSVLEVNIKHITHLLFFVIVSSVADPYPVFLGHPDPGKNVSGFIIRKRPL